MRPLKLSLLLLFCAALPAQAAFHLMKVVEVFPGTQEAPGAQYVVLQMYANGQNIVGGHQIRVFDAADTQIGTFSFAGSVANGISQSKILIGTTIAAQFFDVTTDLTMTAIMPLAGGKVCFDTIDCVAWGNFSGLSTGVGNAFNATGGGLRQGRALKRRLDIAGMPTVLDGLDDTGDSANDWLFTTTPAPQNNFGATGSAPSSACGDASRDGLEACDDGNTVGGDGCRADCAGLEACGDGMLDSDAGETCDDGNTTEGDACPADCGVVAASSPGEVSTPDVDPPLLAARGTGSSVELTFTPACTATDHAVYWAIGPIVSGVDWSESACGLGTTGSASFDPGVSVPGELCYFVVVGHDDTDEGSYGRTSALTERAEATGVGSCDRPIGEATCE